ncbi:MAG: transglycosylase SLT domain-containing protein [Deferribacterales bacterium]
MKKFLVLLTVFLVFSAFADEFEDYKNQDTNSFKSSKDEWTSYKEETERGFEMYKDVMEKEFAQYKNEIAKVWDDVVVSDNYTWVEYLNNYKIRKIVNYDKGEMKIDVVGFQNMPDFTPVVKDVLNEDSATAFYRDPVSSNTEKKIKELVPNVVTDKVKSEPVVQKLYSDKPMTDTQVNSLAKKLTDGAGYTTSKNEKTGQTVYTMTVKLPEDIYKKGAESVKPHVQTYAKTFQLDPALVMAVIFTESRFNPMAKSYVPAYGLMQIVPKSAGLDATKYLEGSERILAPSYLYNPENNVKVGTAYFYLLYYKYFKGVNNDLSRLYCSIAAYNTGAGGVAYAFNKDANRSKYSVTAALGTINSMSSDQVYNYLKTNLRYEEARNYLVRVYGKISDYRE